MPVGPGLADQHPHVQLNAGLPQRSWLRGALADRNVATYTCCITEDSPSLNVGESRQNTCVLPCPGQASD